MNREICFYVVIDSSKEEPHDVESIHITRAWARWHIQNMITGKEHMRIKRGCGRLYE